VIGAAIVSITTNPPLFRAVGPVERWLSRHRPVAPQSAVIPHDRTPSSHRAVVVGYGPVGRTVSRLLQENEIRPTVIEMNVDTVRALRAEGVNAIYGDATHPGTLGWAGIERATT
jgi:CPA2 family monovalent cation:H+ antiporter-2